MSKVLPEWLGVDVGWVYPAVDSDGRIYRWKYRRSPPAPITKAGPVTVRKPDGRMLTRDALSPADAATAMSIGVREAANGVARQVVSSAARTGRGIALENWMGFERRKSAWTTVWRAIEGQATLLNVQVVQVNRAYTSITCPRCSFKARENRVKRDRFCCGKCGLEGQADVIAAMNIAARAAGTFEVAEVACATVLSLSPLVDARKRLATQPTESGK